MSKKMSKNNEPISQPVAQDNPIARLPDETKALLEVVMDNFNILNSQVTNLWLRPAPLEEEPGVIAIVTLTSGNQVALVNAPVLPRIINEHTLDYGEIMQLFMALSEIPGDTQLGIDDRVIQLQMYLPLNVPDSKAAPALDALQKKLWEMRSDLQKAVDVFFGSADLQPQPFPEPHLPKIKVYPNDMKVIFGVLSGCPAHAQNIFLYLIENWEHQGGIITTTGSSICLDMPYGDRQTRLAIFLPAYGRSHPVIGISWDSLNRFEGIPSEAIQNYYKAVEKLSSLRKTESMAYIEVTDDFKQPKARALLAAMKELAGAVIAEKVEPVPVSKSRTDPNLDATLKACPPEWTQVFTSLIDSWRLAGGIVHCPSAGRIYLRFKTHPHQNGRISRSSHMFNLLVLAAPKGKHGCQIDIANGLAADLYSAYLDCIPEAVNHFEKVVWALPGFIKEGTVTRIKLGLGFKPENSQQLLEAILALKMAEEKAE